MSNNIDFQYLELVNHILRFGYDKKDRTGTGTKSIFGWQIRHNMKDGFPLLTTKKMAWKTMVTELLWFLQGDTNIKYLVDNDCHIWNGDAYKNYLNQIKDIEVPEVVSMPSAVEIEFGGYKPLTQEEFINKIKTDNQFAKTWGELGPIYGKQWRSWGDGGYSEWVNSDGSGGHRTFFADTVDQIAEAINLLKTDPDSRRNIVSAWNVSALKEMVLPPCHKVFQFYTRKLSKKERYKIWFQNNFETGMEYNEEEEVDFANKYYTPTPERAISIMVYIRSNDVPLGLPFNIASYALLLEIFARMVNMVSEDLIINIGDAHIYQNQIEGIKEQMTRIPYELPSLEISDCVNFNGTIDDFLDSCSFENFKVVNYKSHPTIKMPLSN